MSLPLFSLIVPALSSNAQLANCLSSIAAQEFINYEVVVILPDHELGSCEAIINAIGISEYASCKCIVAPALGVYNAMNIGIANAAGEWLMFLGQDDIICSALVLSSLSNYITKIQQQPTKPCVLAGAVLYTDKSMQHHAFPLEFMILFRNNIHHQSAIYSKACFYNRGYDESLRIYSDYKLNLQLFLDNAPILRFPEALVIFDSSGISNQLSFDHSISELRLVYRSLYRLVGRGSILALSIGYLELKFLVYRLRAAILLSYSLFFRGILRLVK